MLPFLILKQLQIEKIMEIEIKTLQMFYKILYISAYNSTQFWYKNLTEIYVCTLYTGCKNERLKVQKKNYYKYWHFYINRHAINLQKNNVRYQSA